MSDEPAGALAPSEISKKELLTLTGISYGQLYRWKREGLIPEEWFEKRSAFTGQETFFPRELVLARVRAIQSMKEGLSLSEIREHIAQMPDQLDQRGLFLAVSGMSEKCVDDLEVKWETVSLSDSSMKTLGALYSALSKAGAEEKTIQSIIEQTIAALDVNVASVSEEEKS